MTTVNTMEFSTPDLCDRFPDKIRVATPLFRHFGGRERFSGPIATIKCHEDNVLIREAALEAGQGRILVIDGGGSMKAALVGDGIAEWALDHGWIGMIIFGCVRDTAALRKVNFGVVAIGVNPVTPTKRREGLRDVPVTFADIRFCPGEFAYVDEDGIVVAQTPLPDGPGTTIP